VLFYDVIAKKLGLFIRVWNVFYTEHGIKTPLSCAFDVMVHTMVHLFRCYSVDDVSCTDIAVLEEISVSIDAHYPKMWLSAISLKDGNYIFTRQEKERYQSIIETLRLNEDKE